ncbi:cytochrome P450 [Sistotremastrum suecicum HHB10207 ss-3]|uniref:Cytochrome P450 n=1 Tax=Sistotremastrum suecicum HHB10207 ss-3 TaxID=1314776 RepID=A0A166CAL6_9AGAM|nr:cytochrome P450 [Sistotremastrum suecicum HHB10207 ss-3]
MVFGIFLHFDPGCAKVKYLPRWMPGAGFQTVVAKSKAKVDEVMSLPFEWAKSEYASGNAYDSFVSSQLSRREAAAPMARSSTEDDHILKNVSGSMYIAGVDTVGSVMATFVLMMTLNPQIQKIGQEELDRVVGRNRLPHITDREQLPFVDAILKEVIRFNPPGPLALPHSVTQDDVYQSMFIPKGSRVVPNVWAVTHDDSVYPDPLKFDPTRYLSSFNSKTIPQPNPSKFVFGFGRRRCPGYELAEAAIFLQAASILLAFNIAKHLDAEKREVTPVVEFTGNFVVAPTDFVCRIEPRFEGVLELLEGSA